MAWAWVAVFIYACAAPSTEHPLGAAVAALDETPNGVWELRERGALSVDGHVRLVYHAAMGRVLLVSARPNRGVWSFDGTDWNHLAEPAANLFFQGAAYDSGRDRIILFGGLAADHVGADNSAATWSFESGAFQTIDVRGPSARGGAALAYDAARDRVVLTGGGRHTNADPIDETWLFDGMAWTNAMPEASPASQYAGIAYDVSRQVVVAVRPFERTASETWEWDGASWTNVGTGSPLPYAYQYSLAYDSGRQQVVGIAEGALYAWDGAAWTRIGSDDGREMDRGNAAIAYDVARSRLVAHRSGRITWEHDGTSWHERVGSRPIARQGAAAVYDEARGRAIFFGGTNDARDATWEWDGVRWSNGPSNGPAGPTGVAMAFDRARSVAVTVVDGSTWEYDGASWSNVGTAPGNVTLMAYDAARGETVGLVGGDQTWTYDGGSWRNTMATGPTRVRDGAMAYDAARERVVCFGGYTDGTGSSQIDETWEWDGSSWTQVVPPLSPSPRGGHAMAYDTIRERIVLYGGYRHNEVWEYDGFTWTQRETQTAPPSSFSNGMAYDSARARMVFYASDGTLWEYYPVGAACGTGSECPSGYCVEGVCCDRACTSSCETCTIAGGAESDGICELLPDAGTQCESSATDGGTTGTTEGGASRTDGATDTPGKRDRGDCCNIQGDRRSPPRGLAGFAVAMLLVVGTRLTRNRNKRSIRPFSGAKRRDAIPRPPNA